MNAELVGNRIYEGKYKSEDEFINDTVGYIFLYDEICKDMGITDWIISNIREDKYHSLLNGIIESKYLNDNVINRVAKEIIRYCLVNKLSCKVCPNKKLRKLQKVVVKAFYSVLNKEGIEDNFAEGDISQNVNIFLDESHVKQITKEIINDNLEYIFKNKKICSNENLVRYVIKNVESDKYDFLVDMVFRCKCLNNMMVDSMLENMKDSDFHKTYSDGKTILIKTIEKGILDVEIIKKIIEKKVDLNMQDRDGMTALHHACSGHTRDIEKLEKYIDELLKNGARVDIKDNKGRTPLNCVDWRSYCFGIVNLSDIYSAMLMPDVSLDERLNMTDSMANDMEKMIKFDISFKQRLTTENKIVYLERKIDRIINSLIEEGAEEEELRKHLRKQNREKKINEVIKYFRAFIREPLFRFFVILCNFKKLNTFCTGSLVFVNMIDIVDRCKLQKSRKNKINYWNIVKGLLYNILFIKARQLVLVKINRLSEFLCACALMGVLIGNAVYVVHRQNIKNQNKETIINLYNRVVRSRNLTMTSIEKNSDFGLENNRELNRRKIQLTEADRENTEVRKDNVLIKK